MRHCGLVGTQVITLPTASAMGNKLLRTSGVGRNRQDIGWTGFRRYASGSARESVGFERVSSEMTGSDCTDVRTTGLLTYS
ncbi:hypothetical protein EDB19DRAFT_1720754, partial [Suillus lakei]